jgi:hypothetical protein
MRPDFCGRALSRSTPFTLLPGYLKAFWLPDQAQTIPAAFGPPKGMDPALAEAWILRDPLVNASKELLFLDTA